jgi:hypothetical protein
MKPVISLLVGTKMDEIPPPEGYTYSIVALSPDKSILILLV